MASFQEYTNKILEFILVAENLAIAGDIDKISKKKFVMDQLEMLFPEFLHQNLTLTEVLIDTYILISNNPKLLHVKKCSCF